MTRAYSRGAALQRGPRATKEPKTGGEDGSTTWSEITVSSARNSAAIATRASPGCSGAACGRIWGLSRTAITESVVERLPRGIHGALDRRLVVREGDEPGLELRRRRVDAALQQRPAEA